MLVKVQDKKQPFKHFNSFYYKMSTYKKDNVQALKLNKMKTKLNKTKNILAKPLLNSSLVVVINKVQKFHQKRILTFYTDFFFFYSTSSYVLAVTPAGGAIALI